MDQPPQGTPLPPAPPLGSAPPPRPNKSGTPILLGCGIVLVVLLVVGGFAMWAMYRFVGGVVHTAQSVEQIAKGAAQGAQQSGGQPGATPNPIDVLKGMVNAGKHHVETLPGDDLKGYLPGSAGSLARTDITSGSGTVAGISGTSATATYGDSSHDTIQIELTDAANASGLTAMLDLMMGAVTSESDRGYAKTTDLGDVKVHEKWEKAGKRAQLIGVVGGRFVIAVDSTGVDMSAAEQAFQAVDIAKLSSIAASTPHQ